MPSKDFSYSDLPKEAFPVTLRAFREDNNEEVWSETLEQPGVLVVPPIAKQVGCRVWIKTEFGNGEVHDSRENSNGWSVTKLS